MSPSELRYLVTTSGSNFFDRGAMKFFGDTMKNYGVRSTVVRAQYDVDGSYIENGYDCEVWELYRKRAVKHGQSASAYFAKDDFRRIHSIAKGA